MPEAGRTPAQPTREVKEREVGVWVIAIPANRIEVPAIAPQQGWCVGDQIPAQTTAQCQVQHCQEHADLVRARPATTYVDDQADKPVAVDMQGFRPAVMKALSAKAGAERHRIQQAMRLDRTGQLEEPRG